MVAKTAVTLTQINTVALKLKSEFFTSMHLWLKKTISKKISLVLDEAVKIIHLRAMTRV